MAKETVGKQIHDIASQYQLDQASPEELGQEMLAKQFEEAFLSWVDQGKAAYPGDFYIVMNLKLEQSLNYTPHMIPELRQSAPTPFFDQTVWKYHKSEDRVEFIWVVPDLQACLNLRANALELPEDQKELLGFVLDYYDGTLLNKAKQLNGEIIRSSECTTPNAMDLVQKLPNQPGQ